MGVERILQAAGRLAAFAVAAALAAGPASAAPEAPRKTRERLAVIDLGPADGGAVRRRIAAVVIAGGFQVVTGDGIEDALAGEAADKDTVQLAAAIAEAQRAFGALDCAAATTAAHTAIRIAAARQAAHVAVPELARAWTYVLLCADRGGDVDRAMRAASLLRIAGGSRDVPPEIWAKYPEVDALLDHELLPIEITTEVPGAEIWIDFQRRGQSPLKTFLPAGEHLIAAALGTQRGWAAGTAIKTQTRVTVAMVDQASANRALATRIAGWHGALPVPEEIGVVLDEVKARVALIRHGDALEAWGRIGRSEPPRRLGGEDGLGTTSDAERLVVLTTDRVQTWNDRSPDPDQPLLVEDPKTRAARTTKADEPTRWWVYGALAGALAVGVGVMYVHDTSSNTQRVELHYP